MQQKQHSCGVGVECRCFGAGGVVIWLCMSEGYGERRESIEHIFNNAKSVIGENNRLHLQHWADHQEKT